MIPLADSRFIQRYSDLDRNGTAGELLAKSLHRGWLNRGLLTVFGLVLVSLAGWFINEIQNERYRNSHDIGTLIVHNDIGADLSLKRIRHYGKPDAKPEALPVDEGQTYIAGPADYMLSAAIKDANKKDLNWAYPVFIEDEDTTVSIVIELPPDQEEMAYIPAGTFRMGDKNPEGVGNPDENAPVHDVFLKAFLIDKTEVSNQEFKEFIDAKGYETESLWKDKNEASKAGLEFLARMEEAKQPRYWDDKDYNQDDHPVVGVSWFEARAYCRLNRKELPTEAQWEKAARGPEGYEWSFGNIWDETKANSGASEKDGYGTAPVTAYQANSYGLYNMSGNVLEWLQDAYQAGFYKTTKGKEANPVNNQAEGKNRVQRGGSWYDYIARSFRASHRFRFYPNDGSNFIGFRCARTL